MAATQTREYYTTTNMSLRVDQRAWLEEEARRRGISQAEIVREALDRERDRARVEAGR